MNLFVFEHPVFIGTIASSLSLLSSYLEKLVMIKLNPVLQPSDLRPREAGGHAEERNLPAQHVIQLEVGSLHDLRALRKSLSG